MCFKLRYVCPYVCKLLSIGSAWDQSIVIAKNKKAWQERRKNSNRSGSSDSPKNSTSKNGYSRGHFGKPEGGNGVKVVRGEAYCACRACGWNKTHSSKYHQQWLSDKSNFALPAEHPFSKKLVELGKDPSPAPPAAPAATNPSDVKTVLSGMTAHFDAMEVNTSDPDASKLAAAIRDLFLGKV